MILGPVSVSRLRVLKSQSRSRDSSFQSLGHSLGLETEPSKVSVLVSVSRLNVPKSRSWSRYQDFKGQSLGIGLGGKILFSLFTATKMEDNLAKNGKKLGALRTVNNETRILPPRPIPRLWPLKSRYRDQDRDFGRLSLETETRTETLEASVSRPRL